VFEHVQAIGAHMQAIGAYVGLATGLFVLFDRFVAGRPIASISIRGQADNAFSFLRLCNIGRRDIAVLKVSVRPPIYGVARNDSARAVAAAEIGTSLTCLLKPGEEREFPLIAIDSAAQADAAASRMVVISLSWRKTSATWLWQMPVVLITSTAAIRRMNAAI
jgi:hypothetical protein